MLCGLHRSDLRQEYGKYDKYTIKSKMNTGLTHFKEGNTIAKGKAGKKHLKTLFRENLQNSIEGFDITLYDLCYEFLKDKNKAVRFSAWKELLKYRLVKSKENIETPNQIGIEKILERAMQMKQEDLIE